jgi:RNA polymerase sigma-70 factor (ECF subfamily)
MFDEKQIVKLLKKSDWEVQNKWFRVLFDMYYHDLLNFTLQYVKSRDTAEEIAHDSFVKLWLHKDNLDEKRSVKAYLFKISKNSLIKEMRRQLKNPLMTEYFSFIDTLSTEARITYDYDTFLKTIKEASEYLTPRQKEIFILYKEKNLSAKEIAIKLSISEQVVRNQLSKSLRIIREHLSNCIR